MRDREGRAGRIWRATQSPRTKRISGTSHLFEPTDRWKDTQSGKKLLDLEGADHRNLGGQGWGWGRRSQMKMKSGWEVDVSIRDFDCEGESGAKAGAGAMFSTN